MVALKMIWERIKAGTFERKTNRRIAMTIIGLSALELMFGFVSKFVRLETIIADTSWFTYKFVFGVLVLIMAMWVWNANRSF